MAISVTKLFLNQGHWTTLNIEWHRHTIQLPTIHLLCTQPSDKGHVAPNDPEKLRQWHIYSVHAPGGQLYHIKTDKYQHLLAFRYVCLVSIPLTVREAHNEISGRRVGTKGCLYFVIWYGDSLSFLPFVWEGKAICFLGWHRKRKWGGKSAVGLTLLWYVFFTAPN